MEDLTVSGIVQPELPRSYFDRSRKRIGSYRTGLIYPVEAKIVKPNDHVKIKTEAVIRRLPTIAPSFSSERIVFRWFYVPLRTLWKKFPQWLTGTKEYTDDVPFEEDVPRWTPSTAEKTKAGTLWQALGYPVNCLPTTKPADFKRQAYAYFYDSFMRYKPIQKSILVDGEPGTWTGEDLLYVLKDRDYFTTGLPNQQLGEPVALPITGTTQALWEEGINEAPQFPFAMGWTTGDSTDTFKPAAVGLNKAQQPLGTDVPSDPEIHPGYLNAVLKNQPETRSSTGQTVQELFRWKPYTDKLNQNIVDMTNIASATIAMIRHAGARQIQAENLARSGVMYTDVLKLNWGDAPSDDILGLPTYLGGMTVQVINSEVLQTSASQEGQPLGQLGGHGLGVGTGDEIILNAKEFGVLMGLMYIKTENIYGSQQMPREDEFLSNEDVGWIAYQHLSEQPVKKSEILCASEQFVWDNNGTREFGNQDPTAKQYNDDIFMYQPIYQFMREAQSDVFGLLTQEQVYTDAQGTDIKKINNLYIWTEAYFYSIKNGERPAFNSDFLEMKGDNRNYTITDDSLEADNFIIWLNMKEDWYSVLDKYGTPGFFDHFGQTTGA